MNEWITLYIQLIWVKAKLKVTKFLEIFEQNKDIGWRWRFVDWIIWLFFPQRDQLFFKIGHKTEHKIWLKKEMGFKKFNSQNQS